MEEKSTTLIFDEMSQKIVETAERIAMTQGVKKINVRVLLQELNITNRVFYNRFHNIDEVLTIIYESMVKKIRSDIVESFDPNGDFIEQIIDMMTRTLIMSYENKMQFNLYMFESDSIFKGNYTWWRNEIKKLIEFGCKNGYFKEVDTDAMSYSVWCFIRGFNADAMGRGIPKEMAIEYFKYSIRMLVDGMRAK